MAGEGSKTQKLERLIKHNPYSVPFPARARTTKEFPAKNVNCFLQTGAFAPGIPRGWRAGLTHDDATVFRRISCL